MGLAYAAVLMAAIESAIIFASGRYAPPLFIHDELTTEMTGVAGDLPRNPKLEMCSSRYASSGQNRTQSTHRFLPS